MKFSQIEICEHFSFNLLYTIEDGENRIWCVKREKAMNEKKIRKCELICVNIEIFQHGVSFVLDFVISVEFENELFKGYQVDSSENVEDFRHFFLF